MNNTEAVEVEGPPITLGWRLRIARYSVDKTAQHLADELEVSRETIGNWENDKIRPKRVYIRAWAETTNVPEEFLTAEHLKLVRETPPKPSRGTRDGADEQEVTDNNDYSKQGRKPRRGTANTHSYRYFTIPQQYLLPQAVAEHLPSVICGLRSEFAKKNVRTMWRRNGEGVKIFDTSHTSPAGRHTLTCRLRILPARPVAAQPVRDTRRAHRRVPRVHTHARQKRQGCPAGRDSWR